MNALVILLLKTLLIFAAAGVTLFALRRASAAARHLVCLLALAALLALPGLSLALPGWQMLPAPNYTVGTPLAASFSLPAPNNGGAGKSVGAGLVPAQSYSRPLATSAPSIAAEAGEPNAPPRPFPWPLAFIALYALGVLIALMRPVLGLWGIRQLSRISVPLTDHSVQTLTADCAAALRLPRLPELRQAAVPVPMTWGSRRPTILLPQEAENWPQDRLRAVLLHEMAHIRRQDWLGHRLADVTCALYWFHPLVWLAARRLRAESEAACDDLVLASGIPAPDYARHLLEIARALPPISSFPQTAIAMSQTSQVESRLKMILDKTRNRQAVTRRILLTALGLSFASVIGLAMLRPAVQAQATAQTIDRSGVAGATAQLKQIYGVLNVYRARHGGEFPATNSPALLSDLTAHPQAYGLPDRGTGNEAQAMHLFTSPDSEFMDGSSKAMADKITVYFVHNKRPDGTLVGTAKRAGTRDVLAYSNLYVRNHPPGPTGFYLVLWGDGTISKIPASSILTVPAYDVIGPAGSTEQVARQGGKQIAFPGQAGLPRS